MRTGHLPLALAILVVWPLAFSGAARAQQSCESLASLKIPNVTITAATAIHTPPDFDVPSTPGRFGTPPGLKVSVPFCRVAGFSAPTSDSHIGFEVWLPLPENWNGNFIGVGNPGFIGDVRFGGLAREVARGSAAASTDTGHLDAESATPDAWAIGHPEKVADWGYRAVHETTVVAKVILRAYYGKAEKYSFWSSCHEGGNQALTEAQKFPNDYDGIAAGDPAYYISRLQAASEYLTWVNVKDGVKGPGYIPPSKYPVIHRAVLDKCDALDGVKDGFIEVPTRCHFDVESIRCPGKADYASCLTGPQVETAKKIYEGAKFADGKQIYPGFEVGSEDAWGVMITGPEPLSINNAFIQNVVHEDPSWNFHMFDLDRDTKLSESKYGAVVDSHNPDLSAFKAHGGKLLMYSSWEETAIPPQGLIDYYESVVKKMGGASETSDFARLFMVPGFGMCSGFGTGGNGAWDALDVIEKWRETGVAPDKIIATHRVGGEVDRTHPACPYPKAAIYDGKGDPLEAASFSCGNPNW